MLRSYSPTPAQVGEYYGLMHKAGGAPESTYSLAGRLYVTPKGWALLSVPNALVRGAFDALHEVGLELPLNSEGRLNAHISVIRPNEMDQLGGPDKLTERGHSFRYQLGPLQVVTPDGWDGMSKAYFIKVISPDLEKLRKSYGLSPLPNDNKFQFHLTVAVKKKKVTQHNDVTKHSALISIQDLREGKKPRRPGDILPGGLADNKTDAAFKPESLTQGRKVEGEHTSSSLLAGEIARDHLTEDPEYYKKLKKVEEKGAGYGPPYRCETCCKAFKALPDGIDKCTACSGDLIPEQTFNEKFPDRKKSAKSDRPVPSDWNDPADREDCPSCGVMHERGDGYCNSCHARWPAVTKSGSILDLFGYWG